jgi:hypothetical protein
MSLELTRTAIPQSQFFLSQKLLRSELVPVNQSLCLLLIPVNLNLNQGRVASVKIEYVGSERRRKQSHRKDLQVAGNRVRRHLINLDMSSRVGN